MADFELLQALKVERRRERFLGFAGESVTVLSLSEGVVVVFRFSWQGRGYIWNLGSSEALTQRNPEVKEWNYKSKWIRMCRKLFLSFSALGNVAVFSLLKLYLAFVAF